MTKLINLKIYLNPKRLEAMRQLPGFCEDAANPFIAEWLTQFLQSAEGFLKTHKNEATKLQKIINENKSDLDESVDIIYTDIHTSCWLTDKDILRLMILSYEIGTSCQNLIYALIDYFLYETSGETFWKREECLLGFKPTELWSLICSPYEEDSNTLDFTEIIKQVEFSCDSLDAHKASSILLNYIPVLRQYISDQQSEQVKAKEEIAFLQQQHNKNLSEIHSKLKELTDEIAFLKAQNKELQEEPISTQDMADGVSAYIRANPSVIPQNKETNGLIKCKDISPSELGKRIANTLKAPRTFYHYEVYEAFLHTGLIYNPGNAKDIIRLTEKGAIYGRYIYDYSPEQLNTLSFRATTRWADNVIDLILPYFQNNHVANR